MYNIDIGCGNTAIHTIILQEGQLKIPTVGRICQQDTSVDLLSQ
jgi:hypothetical protein